MSRSGARVVLPGLPHYVTHLARKGDSAFQEPTDYRVFLHVLAETCAQHRVSIWGYNLSAASYDLILVPGQAELLEAAVRTIATEYAYYHNLRHMVRRPVWADSFQSAPMCWSKVWDALVYAERGPLRRNEVGAPWAHPWSSAAARVGRAAIPEWLDVEEWNRYWERSQWMKRLQLFETEAEFGRDLGAAMDSGAAVGGLIALSEVLPRKAPRRETGRTTIAAAEAAG